MLCCENLIRALLIFNGLRSRYCQRALLVYHYRRLWQRASEASQTGCCASLSRGPLSTRDEEQSSGTVLQEVQAMRTRAIHAMP